MKQTVCDHCGKVINNDEFKDIPIVIGGYKVEADLTAECLGKLIAIVDRYLDGEDFEIVQKGVEK